MSVLFMTYCVHLGAKTSGAQNDCFLDYLFQEANVAENFLLLEEG